MKAAKSLLILIVYLQDSEGQDNGRHNQDLDSQSSGWMGSKH